MSVPPLSHFLPATRRWFAQTFDQATPVQQAAWDAIARGSHTLVVAPTGSGKTLAAFLHAIDALFRERSREATVAPGETTRVLYISPVKALAADVARNLQLPLAGVSACRQQQGEPAIALRCGIRSGDTPARERAALRRHPPDILITTPESLYLLLTSQGRDTLRGVTSVIVDEIHALAGNKRGAHLALSLERLDALLARPAQRIGLSATVNPPETVARFLAGRRQVTIVNPPMPRPLQLRVTVPVPDLTAPPPLPGSESEAGTLWPHLEAGILAAVLRHHTTLVFTNSRALAEKLTARLNVRWQQQQRDASAEIARAHHGSVAREQRLLIESALKSGALRCVVATSSLELGIDMGSVGQVIQVGAPPSVASALQRTGRAGHRPGSTPQGEFWPRSRSELLQTAVIVTAMQTGETEPLIVPENPLDILAQQTIAAAAMAPLDAGGWFEQVTRSAPFLTLSRHDYDAVLAMLTGRDNTDAFALLRPRLIHDLQTDSITARPGAKLLAVMHAGAIPDRGSVSVMLPEGEAQAGARRVGELDEEMVYGSRVNDIVTLGATTWRIQQITRDRVIVTPAPGRTARLPFWQADTTGRAAASGAARGRYLRDAATGTVNDPALDAGARNNLQALLREQQAATGQLPDDRTLLIERCADENGDWRLILHSPWGRRVHAPWALALADRLAEQYGITADVVASDDGIMTRLPSPLTFSPADWLQFAADDLQQRVSRAVSGSPLFTARFRECAARALLLPGQRAGQRAPLWQQRLRAAELLDAVRPYPDFPLLRETARECLQDVYDLPALQQLMAQIRRGEVQLREVTTDVPSPFAAALLTGHLADADRRTVPQAEQRAALLTLDTSLLSELLGPLPAAQLLDANVIAQTEQLLQRLTPDRQADSQEAVADLLRELGPLSAGEIAERYRGTPPLTGVLETLQQAGRIIPVTSGAQACFAVAEDAARLQALSGGGSAVPESAVRPLQALIGRYLRTHTLVTADEVARRFDLDAGIAGKLLAETPGIIRSETASGVVQWIAAPVFRRLRLASLQAAREATRPAEPAAWVQALMDHHGLTAPLSGAEGLRRVIAQLAGVALPAGLWESQIFPARVADYHPALLDGLLTRGDVLWRGSRAPGTRQERVEFCPADAAAALLTPPADAQIVTLSPVQQRIVAFLQQHSSATFRQLQQATESDADDSTSQDTATALWDLVWRGRVTSGSWQPLRMPPLRSKPRPARRRRLTARYAGMAPGGAGRPALAASAQLPGSWTLLNIRPAADTVRALALTRALLDRTGVVTHGAARSSAVPGGFPALQPVLRAMEDAGRLLRGRFVSGMGAAQFAEPAMIERIRQLQRAPSAVPLALATLDPANPFGTLLPWPLTTSGTKPLRRSGSWVVLFQGWPLLWLPPGGKQLHTFTAGASPDTLQQALGTLATALRREPRLRFTLEQIDGCPASQSPLTALLKPAGFSRAPGGYSWDG